jgi:hypothetical protein
MPNRSWVSLIALVPGLTAACGGQLAQVRPNPSALAGYLDQCWRQGDYARTTGCSLDIWRVAKKWIAFEDTFGKWTPESWHECNLDRQAPRCQAADQVFNDPETAIAAGSAWRWCRTNRSSPSCAGLPALVDELRSTCREDSTGFGCRSRFAADIIDWQELQARARGPGATEPAAAKACVLTTMINERPASLPHAARFLFKGLDSHLAQVSADTLATYFEAHLKLPPGAALATFKDIERLVSLEMKKDVLGCTEVTCMAEIAGALGADFVVTGEIGQIGSSRLMSIRVVDSRNGAAQKTIVEFDSDDCLNAAVRRAAEIALLGPNA